MPFSRGAPFKGPYVGAPVEGGSGMISVESWPRAKHTRIQRESVVSKPVLSAAGHNRRRIRRGTAA